MQGSDLVPGCRVGCVCADASNAFLEGLRADVKGHGCVAAWDDDDSVTLAGPLDLGRNAHLGDPGLEHLVNGLKSLATEAKRRFRLYKLKLDGCNYSARAALILCDCLRLAPEFLPGLRALWIDHLEDLPGYQEPVRRYLPYQEALTGRRFLRVESREGIY